MAQQPRAVSSSATSPLLSLLHEHSRTGHAALNKSVVPRVLLCLPPHSPDPSIYAAGMTVFSHMYSALEETWDNLLADEDSAQGLNAGQRNALLKMKDDTLIRSRRLDNDLKNMRASLQPLTVQNLDALRNRSAYINTKVTDVITAKPHLVLSYAYALYLGLFNGGRWISGLLADADAQFWQIADKEVVVDTYLSFWYFDDTPRNAQHGQRVKTRFREALNTVAADLTATERQEIVEETQRVFALCAELVGLLDDYVLELGQRAVAATLPSTLAPTVGPDPMLSTAPSMLPESALSHLMSGRLLQGAWSSIQWMIGRPPPSPTQLRKSFEQHA